MLQDKTSIMQVLGCLLLKPDLLSETEKYQLEKADFPEKFHKIVFASINNLKENGTETINEIVIDGFLKDYDIQYEIFNQNDGVEYLQSIKRMASLDNFEYYYQKLKKFSLLREMNGLGFDVSEVYDDSIINPREKEEMQEKFDELTIVDILALYETKTVDLKEKFTSNSEARGIQAGEEVDALLDRLEKSPEIGVPLNSEILTAIARGARKKKYYIRSSITGGGKTRNMIADACRISASELYDSESGEWIENDFDEHSVVISTEMLFEEMQTPALAYIADVDEEKMLYSTMSDEEKARVRYGAKVLKKSSIWFEHLPDFNIKDIERTIEKNIVKNGVEYVFFDYIHSSVSIYSEMSRDSGINLREDQILLLMSDKLKQICNKYEVYLMTATQLNGEWKNAWRTGEQIDGNLIKGSKAIIDKTDFAMILLPISKKEKDEVQPLIAKGFGKQPNFVTHIFKNRGNRHDKLKIFSHINMGTMRMVDCFATNLDHELVKIDKLVIKKQEDVIEKDEPELEIEELDITTYEEKPNVIF